MVLLHGRNPAKLEKVAGELSAEVSGAEIETYLADLSRLNDVEGLAKAVAAKHENLDVLINNAGVFKTRDALTPKGLDVRFVVNTITPYLLTKRLLSLVGANGRVVNISSAAQETVDLDALSGHRWIGDMAAYLQSKLALTMWSRHLALAHPEGPVIVAVNPASMLGSKMVKKGFGVAGGDLRIGADILTRAALSDEFANASGRYFNNDQRRFANPHPDALDARKAGAVVVGIEAALACLS